MATGYTARMHRAGVSLDLHPEPPLPTAADFSAVIYDQAWATSKNHSVLAISVLALDADHARERGERKMEEIFGAGALAEQRLVSSTPCVWTQFFTLETFLASESRADWQTRQDRYAAMEAACG